MSNYTYGLVAGLFFVGYFVAQLPSNVIVTRVGAPRWLAVLLFAWGAVTMCTAGERAPLCLGRSQCATSAFTLTVTRDVGAHDTRNY